MKKKISCALTLAAFLIGVIIYYSIFISLDTATEDLNEFPVPKNAELAVLYMKGNNKIDLITTTKQLEILRVK
ncbi:MULTISPECIES: hypothetical protein [unclassified Bacillus (in: firmicutes)]|uniref:hypothetical protein n=1 Tax=unclassified Bacillus (in: firmicutes) TaxID=185979 RepID=UPI001BE55860|nr:MULTISPECIES: hypothetical protein [unclassified Bacillus (in: firmicutes)]MBT2616954.1 hypothetical protein [Bacillus sp. ISL-78]MBT2628334.1 hypothetical protein [Bacillus sp. ISL-101]MBT2714828.1 hypothetical protein [Bacillus sp. ISL-57]